MHWSDALTRREKNFLHKAWNVPFFSTWYRQALVISNIMQKLCCKSLKRHKIQVMSLQWYYFDYYKIWMEKSYVEKESEWEEGRERERGGGEIRSWLAINGTPESLPGPEFISIIWCAYNMNIYWNIYGERCIHHFNIEKNAEHRKCRMKFEWFILHCITTQWLYLFPIIFRSFSMENLLFNYSYWETRWKSVFHRIGWVGSHVAR